MNNRALLALAVSGFVVFVAAMSFYMSIDAAPAAPDPAQSVYAELARPPQESARTSLREQFVRLRSAREEASEKQALADQAPRKKRGQATSWRRQMERVAEQLDEAATRLRSNLADAPTGRLIAGAVEMQAGQPAAAVEQFDRILARVPGDPSALSAKGAALVGAGNFEEAADAYAELVRRMPNDAAAGYNYGVVLYRLGRFGEAGEQLGRVVRIDRRHALAWYNLATLAQRSGRLADARDAWQAFLELRPEVPSGWFNLGVVWMDFDEPMEAVACFSRVAELRPDERDGWLNLGLAYAAAGHWMAAMESMNRADAVAPCDPLVTICLAQLHAVMARLGGPDAAAHKQMAGTLAENAKCLAQERRPPQAVAVHPEAIGE